MYLKAIEIHGFKSFGEKIFIQLNRGITSIVGPNGSGKSNILDAVLWVLGEQSYKNIRAKESTDVIFSGGKDKKPMKYAEVSIYIDNSDNFLSMEEPEIKITRKLNITGENEYYINDNKSRLKDIGNLFLDTGVGKNAYSVIGQGKVERIIGSSNKEIKSIIEEAAGIKKFQLQKNEAIKNLDNVNNELEKITLILNEVKNNKDKIEKQAEKAQEYLNIKNNYDIVAKELYTCELQQKNIQNTENSSLREKMINELQEIESNFKNINERLSQIEIEREELKENLNEILSKNHTLKNTIDDKEKEKIRLSERISSYTREIADKNNLHLNNQKITLEKENYISTLQNDLKLLNEEIAILEDENKNFELKLNQLEIQKIELETIRDKKKRKLLDMELSKLRLIEEIETSSKKIKSSTTKIKTLQDEIKEYEIKIKELKESESESQKVLTKNKQQLEENIKRAQFLEGELSKISQSLNKISDYIRNAEYDEQRFSNKLTALLKAEELNEGFFKGVKEVLNAKIPGVEGVFISLVEIPSEYEKAIEAGIPGNIQDIVVTTSEVAKKAINLLKERKAGKASFLALDTIKVNPQKNSTIKNRAGVIGFASELIKCENKYKLVVDFLLNNLLVVNNIDTALELLKEKAHSGNIVTLSGELLSSRGRITGGDSTNSITSQIFERKKQIKMLQEQVEVLKNNITKAEKKRESENELLTKYEEELDRLDSTETELKKLILLTSSTLEELNDKILKTQKSLNITKIELDTELTYSNEFEKKITNSSDEKEKIEFTILQLKKEEEEDLSKFQELNLQIKELSKDFSDKKIIFLNSKNKIEQLDRDILREKNNLSTFIEENNNIALSIEKLKNSINEMSELEKRLKDELAEILNLYHSSISDIDKKNKINEDLNTEERALLKNKQEVDSMILHKNDKLAKLENTIINSTSEIQILKENLEKLTEIIIDEEKIIDIAKHRLELKSFESRLRNFETVNLLAIEEFQALNEKYNFINSQREDLTTGKNVLLNLISEIETTINELFYTAYDEINKNFNKMCVETLNNSEGNLNLTDKDSFDECGVEILVKFKNKKRQALSLLSGGEKSMVAIAFIMAIFMYKPSPFTFLDEIEAALDEKNTRKLIAKLKEFNDKSQFILITHNKDTMQESDNIFGVTMNKEIGISKIVPIHF